MKFQPNRNFFYIAAIAAALGLVALIWFWGQKVQGDIETTIEGQYGEMEMRMAENIAAIMENAVAGLISQLENAAKSLFIIFSAIKK